MSTKLADTYAVVDDKDIVIGYKTRDEITDGDIYRVSALWLTNSQGEVLLAQRALSKDHHPGKWGPAAAGTVEANESYEDNIKKEAYEELGLENISFVTGPKHLVRGKWPHFGQWFYAQVDKSASDFKLQQSEVAAVRWFTMLELKQDMLAHPEIYLGHFRELVLQDTFSVTRTA